MLRLNLFGGFTLLGADGAPVVIAARKGRALLAYLALQPRPTPREQVAGLLWGDGGEARARGSLRQALTTLRQEIPGDGGWLEASADAVAVDRRALWVDAVTAHERLQAGDPGAALELAARGELLAGFNPGAAEFDDWADGERRRWRERETAALAALAERARQAGDHRQALALGRRLLKLEPWNEEAHRSVMQALAALGRRSEALRQYQIATEALRAELGVAPDPRTERLLVQIRNERTAPATAPSAELAPAEAPDPEAAPALIGRDLERLQIEGLLKGCRASGRGHVVLIRGEAGMGKTTFLRQALEGARALGFATHLVGASDTGTGRNTEVLRGALAALDAEAHTPAAHRLAVHELLGQELDAAEAALAAALDPEARAQAHVRAVEALVAAAGPVRPHLLAIEDLHWCDAETTRILCAIAAAGHRHRLVTVFTCRTGEEPADRAWAALLGRGSLTSIDLGPLAPEEADRLAARYGDRDPADTRRCLERAAGHPLFLVQLLESGAPNDDVPGSVQAAVLARLQRVAPAERTLLEGAAVMAASFSPTDVIRLVEGLHPDPALPAVQVIDRLVRRGWLRLDGARLTIAHDLLGEAIRSSLQGPRLAQLHRWAAECFAGLDPLRSAEHLDHASDPGAALAYLSVAREALGERRLDLAETVLAHIDALPADPDLAFAALCLRGDVRRERLDPAGSHDVFARAADQARSDGQRAQARLGLAAALRLLDRHPEALARLDEAEAVTAPDDHATRAGLEHLRGNLLFTSGKLAGCRAAHERALAHARAAESPADEVAALSGLGDAFYLEGRVTSARQAFEACHALAHSHGILRMEAAAGMMICLTVFYANDIERSLVHGRAALELSEQIGDARLECLTASILTIVLTARGDLKAGRRQAERTQAAARRLGSERLEAMGIELFAHTLIPEGRLREALPMVRQALTLCRRSDGLAISGPSILAAQGATEAEVEASRAAIREGEELLAAMSCPAHSHFDLRERAMALALRRSEWAEVRRHADALETHLRHEPQARQVAVVEIARLLARLGEQPEDGAAAVRLAAVRDQLKTADLTLLAAWPLGLTAP